MVGVRSQPTLGDYLVREGIISPTQLEQTLEEQANNSRSIGRILVDRAFITESLRISILQKRFGYELVRLKDIRIESILLLLIPYAFAEKHRVVPIRRELDKTLVVAMEDPSDEIVLDTMRTQLGMKLKPVIACQEDIEYVLGLYAQQKATVEEEAKGEERKKSLWSRIVQVVFFPVMLLLAPVLIAAAWYADFDAIQYTVHGWFKTGAVKTGDLVLYLTLGYILWVVVMFEINGLLFGKKKPKEDEDEE